VPLACKVRKAIHNKKREDNMMMLDLNDQKQDDQIDSSKSAAEIGQTHQNDEGVTSIMGKPATKMAKQSTSEKAELLNQLMNDQNQWRFGLTEYEFEEYPERGTKSLFEVKNIDSPILWIRIDPDMEYIRKAKVNQSKENWLF
jgi:hypothetical protein